MGKAKASKEAPSTRVRGKSAPAPGAAKQVIKKDKKSEQQASKRKSALRQPKSKELKKKEKKAKEDSQTTKPNKTQEKKRHNDKNLKDMEKQAGKKDKKHKKESTKKEGKEKDGKEKKQKKVPSSTVPVTPIRNNKALQSSEAGSSETPRSLDTLSDVEKEAEKAKAKGVSLADHMEDMSAKALEEHMQKLVNDQVGEDDDGNQESSEESEEDAAQSEDEASGNESDQDDDQKEAEEKVRALEILGPCPDEKSEDEESENSSGDSSDSESSSESQDETTKDTKDTGKTAEMHQLVAVSNEAETTGKKSLANSMTNKADWDKFSRQCLDKKKFPAELATHFLKDKVCLFNEWLSCGGDWSKVSLVYERKVEDKRKFKKQRKGMKGRDIIASYGETRPGFSKRVQTCSNQESSIIFGLSSCSSVIEKMLKPRKQHLKFLVHLKAPLASANSTRKGITSTCQILRVGNMSVC